MKFREPKSQSTYNYKIDTERLYYNILYGIKAKELKETPYADELYFMLKSLLIQYSKPYFLKPKGRKTQYWKELEKKSEMSSFNPYPDGFFYKRNYYCFQKPLYKVYAKNADEENKENEKSFEFDINWIDNEHDLKLCFVFGLKDHELKLSDIKYLMDYWLSNYINNDIEYFKRFWKETLREFEIYIDEETQKEVRLIDEKHRDTINEWFSFQESNAINNDTEVTQTDKSLTEWQRAKAIKYILSELGVRQGDKDLSKIAQFVRFVFGKKLPEKYSENDRTYKAVRETDKPNVQDRKKQLQKIYEFFTLLELKEIAIKVKEDIENIK